MARLGSLSVANEMKLSFCRLFFRREGVTVEMLQCPWWRPPIKKAKELLDVLDFELMQVWPRIVGIVEKDSD